MLYIIGDLHFGLRKNSSLFHDILLETLNQILRKIKKEDNVILLGDIFDKRSSIDLHILNDAISFFDALSSRCKSISILVGNHDLYYKENVYENVNCRFLQNIAKNITVINELREKTIEGQKCLFVPWIDSKEKYEDAKKKVSSKYDMIFGHFDVSYSDEQESFYMSDSMFTEEQYVCSGHYHQRNQIGKILYVGSLINQSFSDVGNTKGYYTFTDELQFHKVNCPMFEYLTVDNPSEFLTAFETLSENQKNKIRDKVHGNFIKLTLSEYDPLNDKIYQLVKGMTPLELSIEYTKMDFDSGVDGGETFKGFSSNENILSIISEYLDKTKKNMPSKTTQKVMEIVENKFQQFQNINSD
mgnify:CR=1 FL=1